MAEKFYTILTAAGKAKIANALPTGQKVNLTKMKFGDSNGAYYTPNENQTDLKNTVYECNITTVGVDEKNPNWITLTSVIPPEIGGFTIREIGVYDDTNTLIAVGKYPETYKPVLDNGSTKELYVKMTLEVSNTNSVELKVDPYIILATKGQVDEVDKRLSSQMDTIEQQKANQVDLDKINSKARLKSELIGLNDFSEDAIRAMSGNANFNLTSIPKANSVDILQLKNKSKVNLYNKNTITQLKYVDNTGNIQEHASLCLSDYISVSEGSQITISRAQTSVGGVYNSNKEWICKIPSPSSVTSPYTFTVPTDGCYIRINEYYVAINEYIVVEGEALPSSYYEYGAKIDWLKIDGDNIEKDSITSNKIPTNEMDITCLKDVVINNLFNKSTITANKYVDNEGNILDSDTLCLSDFISTRGVTSYTVPVGYTSQGAYYDKDKKFIAKITNATSSTPATFTTPENCYYIRLNLHKNLIDTFMCVIGDSYPSEYKSYGVTIPLLNANANCPLQGKNIYIFGDSRTWYNGQLYGDGTKTEFKGQTCVGYQQEIINRTKANITSFGYNGKNSIYICERIKEQSFVGVDMVILDGGVNDYIVGANLGELKDIGSVYDANTVYGAWQSAIEHIMTSNPKCKIIINTPFVCWNASGKLPSNIALTKKEIANLYSLDCLDLYNLSNINEFNRDNFYVDDYSLANQWRLHLNDFGNKWIGGIIANFILTKWF